MSCMAAGPQQGGACGGTKRRLAALLERTVAAAGRGGSSGGNGDRSAYGGAKGRGSTANTTLTPLHAGQRR